MTTLNLNWTHTTLNDYHAQHSVTIIETTEHSIQHALYQSIDKAVSLLEENIHDHSLYLLFEWQSETCCLTITVTDATKTQDSPQIVRCIMPTLAQTFNNLRDTTGYHNTSEEFTETLKYWLHDYLTTCTGFFRYSLVAIFHNTSRENTELL